MICTIIRLTTSFWPSLWGWKVVGLVILVSSNDQRIDQNVLRNRLSRYETTVCEIQKCIDSFKEDLGSGLCYDALLVGDQDRHLGKKINNHKDIVISPLSGWKARHVVH
jgi:hypothetical protein